MNKKIFIFFIIIFSLFFLKKNNYFVEAITDDDTIINFVFTNDKESVYDALSTYNLNSKDIQSEKLVKNVVNTDNDVTKTENLYGKKETSSNNSFIKYIIKRNPNISIDIASSIYDSVKKNSEKYNVDIYIIMAMIQSESNFNPNSVGNNVHGLMQIHENTAPYVGLDMNNIYDIDANISAGIGYLSKYLNKYNDMGIALTVYSHGEGTYLKGSYSNFYKDKVINASNVIRDSISNL